MIGQGLAACAGICGAMASVSAKLAMASKASLGVCEVSRAALEEYSRQNDYTILQELNAFLPPCGAIITYIRLSFFALIFLFNALMWTLFTKSLQKCTTTVEATVINTSCNLLLSAVAGCVVFGETLSLVWLAGASLIIIGLVFIHSASSEDQDDVSEKKTS